MPEVTLHHGTLFKKGGQAGNHFLHYRFGDGVDASSLPGDKVERARLITANHAGCRHVPGYTDIGITLMRLSSAGGTASMMDPPTLRRFVVCMGLSRVVRSKYTLLT